MDAGTLRTRAQFEETMSTNDDFDQPAAKSRSTNTLIILAAVGGGLALLCLLGVVISIAAVITLGENASATFQHITTAPSSGRSK
jgi:hypothetical protein